MQHTDRHTNPDAHLDDGIRHARRRCFCASCTQALRAIGTLAAHPLVLLNMPHSDLERYRCAHYLHSLASKRQAELSRSEMLDAIERCRCHPGDVGRELAHADRLH